MTRRSLRTALADKIGVDLADNDGIVIELRHIPQKPGLQTVRIIPAKELSALLDELVSTESREAVHRAQERAHRAENELRTLQLAAARKEREMAETTEHGKTVSLHERLWRAATGTIMNSDGEFWRIPEDRLAAIEAAIREDEAAPLRARIAEYDARLESADTRLARAEKAAETLAWENSELKKAAVSMSKTCDEWAESYSALKARADELYGAAKEAERIACTFMLPGSKGHIRMIQAPLQRGIDAYDAADRAGETQDGGEVQDALAFLADKKKDTIAEVVADAFKPGDQTADQVIHVIRSINGGAMSVPPDINWHGEFGVVTDRDGKTSSWVKSDTHPHLNYDTRPAAPSPTDAPAIRHELIDRMRSQVNVPESSHLFPMVEEGVNEWLDSWDALIANGYQENPSFVYCAPTDAAAEVHTNRPSIWIMSKQNQRIADLERKLDELHRLRSSDSEFWRGLNNTHSGRVTDLERWREVVDEWLTEATKEARQALKGVKIAEEQRALESRQGGVPEVVTPEMVEAFWQEYANNHGDALDPASVRLGLAAALAVMGTGGAKS